MFAAFLYSWKLLNPACPLWPSSLFPSSERKLRAPVTFAPSWFSCVCSCWPSRALCCLLWPWQRKEVRGCARASLVTEPQERDYQRCCEMTPHCPAPKEKEKGRKALQTQFWQIRDPLGMLHVVSLNSALSLDFWSQMGEILALHPSHPAAVDRKDTQTHKSSKTIWCTLGIFPSRKLLDSWWLRRKRLSRKRRREKSLPLKRGGMIKTGRYVKLQEMP